MNDFGIIWEAEGIKTDAGIAVFDSYDARAAAREALAEQGYDYQVSFQDVKGPGLSWSRNPRLRCNARKRLPSYKRAIRDNEQRGRLNAMMVGNPGYDLR